MGNNIWQEEEGVLFIDHGKPFASFALNETSRFSQTYLPLKQIGYGTARVKMMLCGKIIPNWSIQRT